MSDKNQSFSQFTNLYELSKTLRFELKPSEITFEKLENNKLFKVKDVESKIFSKNENGEISEAEKKVKNYLFDINETELNNLVKKCDEKIEEIKKIKDFLEKNPDKLWQVWIDNEKIKIIDKDLKYILQEKKSWEKSFWNEAKNDKKTGNLGVQSTFRVEWKKGLFLTFDDVDAYFEKIRSTENSERKVGEFTKQVIERLDFLLKQYRIRELQLLLNTKGDTEQNEKKLFQTKKERVARIRNYLGIFLKLERICSLFNYTYEDSFCEFPLELKENLEEYNLDLKNIISEVETIFSESNLYLHKNIERKFTLNIRAINPRPESDDPKNNKKLTEDKILEKIEELEENISNAKRLKAELKGERSYKKNNGERNYEDHKKQEWDTVLKELNPSNEAGLFSQLTQLRRDLEEVHLTHFGVLLEKDGLFYLALENKRVNNGKNGDIKKMGDFELQNFFKNKNKGNAKYLSYKNITFKALRRLCLEKTSSMKTKYFLNKENESWTEFTEKGRRKREQQKNWREEKYFDDLKQYLQEILKNKAGKIGVKFTDNDFKEWENIEWDEDLKNLSNLIDKQGYKATWNNFDWDALQELEESTEIEIFQIYNKDFLIDPDFAVSDKDKEKVERMQFTKDKLEKEGKKFIPKYKNPNKKEKQNLYTTYWQNFFADKSNKEFRIKPEGKFYVRLASEDAGENGNKKLLEKETKKEFEKIRRIRFTEDKILADFNLWINPTIDKVQSKVKKKSEVKNHIDAMNKIHKTDETDFYVLGLDRGLNSLVSYGLFDSNLNIVQINGKGNFQETQNKEYDNTLDFVCGDWSLVNSKGVFVKREKIFDDNEKNKYFLKCCDILFYQLKKYLDIPFVNPETDKKLLIDEYYNQFIYDSEKGEYSLKILDYEGKQSGNSGELGEYYSFVILENDNESDRNYELRDENGNEIIIRDKDDNKVFDYVLSFYVEKAKRIFALKKQQDFNSALELTKEEVEEVKEFLFQSVEELKEGFTNFVIGEIVKLSKNIAEQKNKKLYIVFEDLVNYGKNKGEELEKSFTEMRHEENLSVLVYQKLENNLVEKFNYLQTKDKDSNINKTQFSPKIQRIEDIKELQKEDKKGGQLGNLIFVDPENTSKQCPNCLEIGQRKHSRPTHDFVKCKKCGFDTRNDDTKKGFDFIDGGDTLAAYNIAKRGLKFLKEKNNL